MYGLLLLDILNRVGCVDRLILNPDYLWIIHLNLSHPTPIWQAQVQMLTEAEGYLSLAHIAPPNCVNLLHLGCSGLGLREEQLKMLDRCEG